MFLVASDRACDRYEQVGADAVSSSVWFAGGDEYWVSRAYGQERVRAHAALSAASCALVSSHAGAHRRIDATPRLNARGRESSDAWHRRSHQPARAGRGAGAAALPARARPTRVGDAHVIRLSSSRQSPRDARATLTNGDSCTSADRVPRRTLIQMRIESMRMVVTTRMKKPHISTELESPTVPAIASFVEARRAQVSSTVA